MDLGLKDKKALVTGASRGLGYAVARGLLSEGAQVAINSRDENKLEAAKDNNLFILDAGLGKLIQFGSGGFAVYQLASEKLELPQPRGLAVDQDTNVYISDIKRDRVLRFPLEAN